MRISDWSSDVCSSDLAAGAITLHDAAHLVRIRGQLLQDAAPAGTGAMAAVIGAEDDLVRAACSEASGDEVVVPANFHSPCQSVIGGDAAGAYPALALPSPDAPRVGNKEASTGRHT